MAMSADEQAYDVQVEFTVPEWHNRFWAIPILGIVVKLILLIPHLIILSVLGTVAELLALVTWIPVLFGGHYPSWGYDVIGGTLRWGANVSAYLYGLTDRTYPPFRILGLIILRPPRATWSRMIGGLTRWTSPFPEEAAQPAAQTHEGELWAIPVEFIGIVIKLIILIPHLILLYVLGIVATVNTNANAYLWSPVDSREDEEPVRRPLSLLGLRNHRRVPTIPVDGHTRAILAYYALFGLTDQYPPFRLGR